jgi:delta 1-pyrroline-5-carboxylate dehydrogenase
VGHRRHRHAIDASSHALRFAAGNFCLNDKPTGIVVGLRPFGGGPAGTNDKAGSSQNLLRCSVSVANKGRHSTGVEDPIKISTRRFR